MTTAARGTATLAIMIALEIGRRVGRATREEVVIISITISETVAGMIAVNIAAKITIATEGTRIVEAALRSTNAGIFAVTNTTVAARGVEMKAKAERAAKVTEVSIEILLTMTVEEDALSVEKTMIVEAEISRSPLVEGLIRMIEIGKATERQAEMTGATKGAQLPEVEKEGLGEELWTVADLMSETRIVAAPGISPEKLEEMFKVVCAMGALLLLRTWNDETLDHGQPTGRQAPWAAMPEGRFRGQGRQPGLRPVSGYNFQIYPVIWTMVS